MVKFRLTIPPPFVNRALARLCGDRIPDGAALGRVFIDRKDGLVLLFDVEPAAAAAHLAAQPLTWLVACYIPEESHERQASGEGGAGGARGAQDGGGAAGAAAAGGA